MKESNWIVRVEATVTKDVYCVGCTEEEAATDPFEHAEQEEEVDQKDYRVLEVKPND